MLAALSISGTLLVNGVVVRVDDLTDEARRVSNLANLHQIATVPELYYLDHGTYPHVFGGEALIENLYEEGYLRTLPVDSRAFLYGFKDTEDYYLALSPSTTTP